MLGLTIKWLLVAVAAYNLYWLIMPAAVLFMAKWFKKVTNAEMRGKPDIACIITLYRDGWVAAKGIEALINQNYNQYHIYVVADRVPQSEIDLLPKNSKVTYLQPEPALNSKVKSMRFALENANQNHDSVVIFDADNIASPDFLTQLSLVYQQGYNAVQGKRSSDQWDTNLRSADNLREKYYNHYQRQLFFEIGGSAALAGSAALFNIELFKSHLFSDDITHKLSNGVISGEDKQFQVYLAQQSVSVAYQPKAIVFDDKIDGTQQTTRQRMRWFNAYFSTAFAGWVQMMVGGLKLDAPKFFGGAALANPPLIFQLIGTSLMVVILPILGLYFWLWATVMGAIAMAYSFLIFVRAQGATISIFEIIKGMLSFIPRQIEAIIKVRTASKDFLVTRRNS